MKALMKVLLKILLFLLILNNLDYLGIIKNVGEKKKNSEKNQKEETSNLTSEKEMRKKQRERNRSSFLLPFVMILYFFSFSKFPFLLEN